MPTSYAERPPDPDLAGSLACVWTSEVEGAPGSAHVLPDACIDILWTGGDLVVAGPDTGPRRVPLPAGTTIAALRFRPGAGPTLLGVPAAAIRDVTVPLADLWGRRSAARLADLLAGAPTASARLDLLQDALRQRSWRAGEPDPVARALLAALRAPRARPVARFAETVGLSERQLHRRCVAAFGYGAKTLDRVLRMQRFLALARSPRHAGLGLAALAGTAGYADQSHLSRECRTLADATPAALAAAPAGVRSVQDGGARPV